MTRRYGLPELLEALRSAQHPLFGSPEMADWHTHRASSIARALGLSLDALSDELRMLLAHSVPHPADKSLEYSLVEMRFEIALRPVHAAAHALVALYREEALRIAEQTWGRRDPVDHEALLAAGLTPSREPDWRALAAAYDD